MGERITPEEAGARLDVYLAKLLNVSRENAQRLIGGGHATVNGAVKPASYRVKPNDTIAAAPPPVRPTDVLAEDIAPDVLFEDEDVIVVNKPQGMAVHPSAGHEAGTLVNALLHHCGGSLSGINGERRPGIVHRIDKDTSGALVVAKNDYAHNNLAAQFAEHSITRLYNAVVVGGLDGEGVIDKPLGRDPKDRKRFAVVQGGKRAVTHWRVLEPLNGHTLVECRLETGRTHQIRVHMAHINRPVLGDPVYGGKNRFGLIGQALHAEALGFAHPRGGAYMEFHAPFPDYWAALIARLKL